MVLNVHRLTIPALTLLLGIHIITRSWASRLKAEVEMKVQKKNISVSQMTTSIRLRPPAKLLDAFPTSQLL